MTSTKSTAIKGHGTTVEFLGILEPVFNPGFNHGEFATIQSQAGLYSYKLSVKEWVEKSHAIGLKDSARRNDGTVLANIEGMNAEFIHMKLPQGDRLKRLNQIAIRQMQTLAAYSAVQRLNLPKAGGRP